MVEASSEQSEQSDRRSQTRQIMILRVALLEQASDPFFCLVKNVSSTGIQVKLYGSNAGIGPVVIRVADENPIRGKIGWINHGNAGISFEEIVNPAVLLRWQQKLGPVRRRSIPRVKASARAALRIDGRIFQAVLKDISSMGARVTASRALEVGSLAIVALPHLPNIRAYVRWTECSEFAGLAFETPIPMHILSQWIDGQSSVAI